LALWPQATAPILDSTDPDDLADAADPSGIGGSTDTLSALISLPNL
jgi:hypothetical protein